MYILQREPVEYCGSCAKTAKITHAARFQGNKCTLVRELKMIQTSYWLEQGKKNAPRQYAKDRLVMELLRPYFVPGSILELGAGVGQLSSILTGMGFDTTASDVDPEIVEFMQSQRIKSMIVDARHISQCVQTTFDNVLASGITPMINRELGVQALEDTYRSVFEVLNPGGRFIVILGTGYDYKKKFIPIKEHFPIIRKTGFTLLHYFRNQLFPSSLYSKFPKKLLAPMENTVARWIGTRYVLVCQKGLRVEG